MKFKTLCLAIVLTGTTSFCSNADDRFANVEMDVKHLNNSVHMMVGSGGNIGLSAGDDGILMIDDQYAPLAEKISAALEGFGTDKPRYVVNTHYHGDHTGSNAFFQDTKGATIFAHENVRIRLASDPEVAAAALPVVTYQDGLKFHFNGETIHVIHLPGGHTDGDSIVWFEQSNVMHTGDLFFRDWFPYVDLKAGGSVDGYLASIAHVLDMINDETQVIPGHGALATKADLISFKNMIEETKQYVQKLKADGLSEDQAVEKGLESKWDEWAWQFITEERWIRTLYK
ncbi:MBL fold metallo-hydrolase [Alteromonas facilis]|uniref:MBL fold metallo-hydrolase n=1 Tax=Alteromonas facilis TaxID=2048004 RepID=UPI000C28121F|nr:MBL fold metallo-hydrolase [Alteromonas facilis]